MMRAVKAAFAYWAMIFALGFILGTIRTIWVSPLLGDALLAVLIELPVMIAASWFCAFMLVQRFALDTIARRAVMGILGFALLIAAEAATAMILMSESLAQWAASLLQMPGLAGLAAQLLFAIFPMMQRTHSK